MDYRLATGGRQLMLSVVWVASFLGCGRADRDPVELRRDLQALASLESSNQNSPQNSGQVAAELTAQSFVVPEDIQAFCGNCHRTPLPSSFPREVWYDEIHKGFEFYARSGRNDLAPPAPASVVELYRQHAPVTIQLPMPFEIDLAWRQRFTVESVDWRDSPHFSPAISSLRWVPSERSMALDQTLSGWADAAQVRSGYLLATDMRDGSINQILTAPQNCRRRLLARTNHPARVSLGDIDNDGRDDLLVSDLGSFSPYDHTLGKVLWIKASQTPSQTQTQSPDVEVTTVVEDLGRIADVAIADFNGDGANDLLVAEFGHRHSGGIHLLLNAADHSPGVFRAQTQRTLDIRPGTVQLAIDDFNRDGSMDFAAVISQEFECVDLFLNRVRKFDRHRLAQGTDLTFGSVGLEMSDIDGDGDQDMLYVNGDSFDNNFANASHGIQLLENCGQLAFETHRLIDLPGAYRAVAADLDGDGDLDIVAVANLPTIVYPEILSQQEPVSLLCLEQVERLKFVPHVLERGLPRYPALEVADFNGDGKMDIAVGTQLFDTDSPDTPAAQLPPVTIWWQR